MTALVNQGAEGQCFGTLRDKMAWGYQLHAGDSSYFIIEGDLPRPEVAACARRAFLLPVTAKDEGDTVVFTYGGTDEIHAAWRGRYVVIGSREQVKRALAGEGVHDWRAHVARLSKVPMHSITLADYSSRLFDVPSSRLEIIATKLGEGHFDVTLQLHYDRKADASHVHEQMTKGQVAMAGAPSQLAETLRRTHPTLRDSAVELRVDSAQLTDIDLEPIMAWVQAQAPARASAN